MISLFLVFAIGLAYAPTANAWIQPSDSVLSTGRVPLRTNSIADFSGTYWLINQPRYYYGGNKTADYSPLPPTPATLSINLTNVDYVTAPPDQPSYFYGYQYQIKVIQYYDLQLDQSVTEWVNGVWPDPCYQATYDASTKGKFRLQWVYEYNSTSGEWVLAAAEYGSPYAGSYYPWVDGYLEDRTFRSGFSVPTFPVEYPQPPLELRESFVNIVFYGLDYNIPPSELIQPIEFASQLYKPFFVQDKFLVQTAFGNPSRNYFKFLGPLCISGDRTVPGGAQHFSVYGSNETQFNAVGEIEGTISPRNPVFTKENLDTNQNNDRDIYTAIINVYKQENGFIRDQGPNETNAEYQTYLATQERTIVRTTNNLSLVKPQKFFVNALPLFNKEVRGGKTFYKPIYYSVEVVKAETEERNINILDREVYETLYFLEQTKLNVMASETPSVGPHILLDAFHGIAAKEALIQELSRLSPNFFKVIEEAMQTSLNQLKADPTLQTPEKKEALRRAFIAERAVRDGSVMAEQQLEIMTTAIATIMADLWDDIASHYRDKRALTAKKLKGISPSANIPDRYLAVFGTSNGNIPSMRTMLEKLEQADKDGAAANQITKGMKIFWDTLGVALLEMGVEPKAVNILVPTMKRTTVLMGVAIKGAYADGIKGLKSEFLQKAVKFIIEETGIVLKAALLDGPVFSFNKNAAPYLQYSLDMYNSWNVANAVNLSSNTTEAYREISLLHEEASNSMDGWTGTVVSQVLGERLDVAQDAFEIFSANKYFKAAEKASQIMKYLTNVTVVARPMNQVFNAIPDRMNNARYYAFGVDPTTVGQPQIQALAAGGATLLATSAFNPRFATSITALNSSLISVTTQIADSILANSVDNVLDLLSGPSQDNYYQLYENWQDAVDLINLQTLGSTNANLRLLTEYQELRALFDKFQNQLADVTTNIFQAKYQDATDPAYVVEQATIAQLASHIQMRLNAFEASVNQWKTDLTNTTIKPAINVKVLSILSDSTGKDAITQSPEVFTVRAHIQNISDAALANLSAELGVVATDNSVSITTPQQLIGTGTLSQDDNSDGAGTDEATVEWKVTFNGQLGTKLAIFTIDLLENLAEPVSFVFLQQERLLMVDAVLFDQDGDLIPDDWEVLNGLNKTVNDALADLDGDQLSNILEFSLDTDPRLSDTDNDLLSDNEELENGTDGFITDPLDSDTDDDGVIDGNDGDPLNPDSITAPIPSGEPMVAIDKTQVVLTKGNPLALVNITNGGSGKLDWRIRSASPELFNTMPKSAVTRGGNGLLAIMIPPDYDFTINVEPKTYIRVTDVSGAINDFKDIIVSITLDTDTDGLPDSWETTNFGNLTTADGTTDFDGDGLLDIDEFLTGTDPKDTDTDGDGMTDGWEIDNLLDPRTNDADLDADGDGYTNLEEYLAGTDPRDINNKPAYKNLESLFYIYCILKDC